MTAYIVYIKNSAKNWEVGIGGKMLVNDGVRCTVPIPEYSNTAAYELMFDRAKHSPV